MKRRAEYLVSKRDGRREWLRATKLARSLSAAMEAVGDETAHLAAIELASAVLEAVRRRDEIVAGVDGAAVGAPRVTTAELAVLAERALFVSGRPNAAVRYAAVRDERRRRATVVVSDRRRGLDLALQVDLAQQRRRRITFGRA